jgi:hypothetical protein
MSTLYELDQALKLAMDQVFENIDPETGEITDQIDFTVIDQLNGDRNKKLEGIGCYIKNLTAEIDAIKSEIATLSKRASNKKRKIEHLKKYVTESLNLVGQNKFETAKVAYSFRKSKSVNVINIDNIPDEYVRLKTEKVPDKTAIKKAIISGETIPGASIETSMNLQVK